MSERQRRAPAVAATSDVTRFRGLAVAASLALAVTVAVALVRSERGVASGAPGPLSRPHLTAELACASCHGEQAPATACVSCHGGHESTRAAHRELASAGALVCSDCHAIHRADGGVVLTADGRAIRYGPGAERELSAGWAGAFRPTADVTVPIVEVAACARCHDTASDVDPIARCLTAGTQELGDRRPTICFGEHSDDRVAAWEAAREVAHVAPAAPIRPGARRGPWSWLGLGTLAAMIGWGGARAIRRPRVGRRDVGPERALVEPPRVRRLPTINASTCLGCYACVDACPYDVLEIHRYVARVARPADCCGLTLCEQRCPNGSLVMSDDGVPIDRPVAVDPCLQSQQVPGLYLAGDITGLPLIRNAINQGAHVVREIAAAGRGRASELDLAIVGAGPAGISAALEAKARGLRFLALEQGTVAGSIQSFPRGKLVFDQPLDIPLIGPLWLEEATKEELCAKWMQIVRRERLPIREGVRVDRIERDGDGFVISAIEGEARTETIRARRVLLAIGRRGSPRPLPFEVPPAAASRVHYSLADARSFGGQRVIVVGLGDMAMETAIAISRQPATQVTVIHRGADFSRGKTRNIQEIKRRMAAGAIQLWFETQMIGIDGGRATVSSASGIRAVACDAVFVMIGSILPTRFLQRVGLEPDKES